MARVKWKSQPTKTKLEKETEYDGYKCSDRIVCQPLGSGRRGEGTSEVRLRHEEVVSCGEGLSHGRASRWLLQRGRPHEVLGEVGRFLGWLLGLTVWRRILLGARDRLGAGWRSIGGLDRCRPGGRGGSRRFECHRCRSVQHRHTKRQHRYLRDRHKGGGVSGSCSWNFHRGGKGQKDFEHIETNRSDRSCSRTRTSGDSLNAS